MEFWLEWARGPVFISAFTFMLLGLARQAILTIWETTKAIRRAGDKNIQYLQIFFTTLKWLFPLDKLQNRFFSSLTSALFHIAILITPIFLAGHVALWERGLGVSWPTIPNKVADALTIMAIAAAAILVIQRASARATRALSRFQDYALTLLVAMPFIFGFLMMSPSINPFSYETTFFIHVMSANLIFVLIPITKLSHMVLLPSVQLISEVSWRWPPDAGSKLAATLGKENEAI